jgi:hypothetical protein
VSRLEGVFGVALGRRTSSANGFAHNLEANSKHEITKCGQEQWSGNFAFVSVFDIRISGFLTAVGRGNKMAADHRAVAPTEQK